MEGVRYKYFPPYTTPQTPLFRLQCTQGSQHSDIYLDTCIRTYR